MMYTIPASLSFLMKPARSPLSRSRSRRWAIALLLLGASIHVASAGSSSEPLVVKTFSGVCGRSDQTLIGSGTLFRSGSSIYILTSEHAVVHAPGSRRYCHSIQGEDQIRREAEYVAADWGTGLALLRLQDQEIPKAAQAWDIPTLDTISSDSKSAPVGAVSSLGYPQSSQHLSSSTGRMLTEKGDRHLIPFLKRTIETVDVHGEYGMSGGALIDSSGRFHGVISHQYFVLTPGDASPVREFSRGQGDLQNYLFIIPAPEAWTWTNRVLAAGTSFQPGFTRDAEEQIGLKNSESIISENIRFELKRSMKSAPLMARGGGHGAGVTGLARETGARIQVSVVRGNRKSAFELPSNEAWFRRLQSMVVAGSPLSIEIFTSRSGPSKEPVRFGSLAEFAAHLQRTDLIPLARDASASGATALAAVKDPISTLRVWLDNESSSGKPFEASDLIRELQVLQAALETENLESVSNEWLSQLIHERTAGWSAFMQDEPSMQDVVSVISALREIQTHLRSQ